MTATDDRRLWADDGASIPISGDERPAGTDAALGHSRFTGGLDALREPFATAPNRARIAGGCADGGPVPKPALFASVEPVHGLLVAHDRGGAIVTLLAAREPSEATYSRTSTGRVLGEIDEQLVEAAWRDNARLRQERDAAAAEAGREFNRRTAAESALRAARDRIAELELAVKALGEVIAHAAGHDKSGDTAPDTEGGE